MENSLLSGFRDPDAISAKNSATVGRLSDPFQLNGYAGRIGRKAQSEQELHAKVVQEGFLRVTGPALAGKTNFGFVSKYLKGSNVPTGETEFQLHFATFNFHSTSYQWLVVSGARAQYKGTGKINGAGNYGFLLTATDGQINGGGGVDKFRIKIWDIATSATVYDNVMGASDDIDTASPQEISGDSMHLRRIVEGTAKGAKKSGGPGRPDNFSRIPLTDLPLAIFD